MRIQFRPKIQFAKIKQVIRPNQSNYSIMVGKSAKKLFRGRQIENLILFFSFVNTIIFCVFQMKTAVKLLCFKKRFLLFYAQTTGAITINPSLLSDKRKTWFFRESSFESLGLILTWASFFSHFTFPRPFFVLAIYADCNVILFKLKLHRDQSLYCTDVRLARKVH